MLRPAHDISYEVARKLFASQLVTEEEYPQELKHLIALTQDQTTGRVQFAEDVLRLWRWLIRNPQCLVREELIVYETYCLKFAYRFVREGACRSQ
jgi:hypothetical protein